MEFFQIKKKNTFCVIKCGKCDFSSYSNEELSIHEESCKKTYVESSKITYTSKHIESNGCIDKDIIMDISNMNTPHSLKVIMNNNAGSITEEKYLVNESIELEHFVERNQIKLPQFNACFFDLSEGTINKSMNGLIGSATYSQNNCSNISNTINDYKLNSNNLNELPKQDKLCIISPSDYKDRKDKNKKCIVCKNLKIGEIVRIFECYDLVHLHCFKEEQLGGICPLCNKVIK